MDHCKVAVAGLRNITRLFLQDLEALPEEAFLKHFGGKARTIADIVAEVNLVNDHVGLTVRGEPLFDWPEGWIKAPDSWQTKEQVVDAYRASSESIVKTFEAFTEEQILEPLLTDGNETTRLERCRFISVHLWYHSGQLNFMQTLLGDDAWHWK